MGRVRVEGSCGGCLHADPAASCLHASVPAAGAHDFENAAELVQHIERLSKVWDSNHARRACFVSGWTMILHCFSLAPRPHGGPLSALVTVPEVSEFPSISKP